MGNPFAFSTFLFLSSSLRVFGIMLAWGEGRILHFWRSDVWRAWSSKLGFCMKVYFLLCFLFSTSSSPFRRYILRSPFRRSSQSSSPPSSLRIDGWWRDSVRFLTSLFENTTSTPRRRRRGLSGSLDSSSPRALRCPHRSLFSYLFTSNVVKATWFVVLILVKPTRYM